MPAKPDSRHPLPEQDGLPLSPFVERARAMREDYEARLERTERLRGLRRFERVRRTIQSAGRAEPPAG